VNASGNLGLQAYERIRTAIAEGQLPPSLVIREIDLVREYGMSRTPIREALHRLHAEGLIRQVGPGGYVALELSPKQLTDIYQVREVLAGLAARLAAQHRSRVDLARLQDLLDALDQAFSAKEDEKGDQLVRAYWRAIAEASGNDYLRTTLARVTDLFRYKALAVTHPEWQGMLTERHRRVVEAIAAGDQERAEQETREIFVRSLEIRIASDAASAVAVERNAG
jgi:DNA-binding GntR family transcriptional regulator